jgi:hypothetical protein
VVEFNLNKVSCLSPVAGDYGTWKESAAADEYERGSKIMLRGDRASNNEMMHRNRIRIIIIFI